MIDQVDRAILKLLQKDAKMTFKELANKLNLTSTPVYERVKRMEEKGIIKSYTAVVDRAKLGFSLIAMCSIALKEHQTDVLRNFEKEIKGYSEVLECFHLTGNYDYFLKVAVLDMDDYQNFLVNKLATIKNISRVESAFVLTEVKSTIELPMD